MARARVAHLAGIDHRHRQRRSRQRGHERDLAPAGRLHHDQLGLQRLQARAHLGDARLVMGADPLLSAGPYGDVQLRFGDVDAYVGHVAEIHVALLLLLPPQTARPCNMRARWPQQLFGLWRETGAATSAYPRSQRTQGESACHAPRHIYKRSMLRRPS
jgi:hypothetical protein